jgi:chromosome segregation ATPase
VQKITVIAFVIGLVLGAAGSGLIAYVSDTGELESARQLSEQYRSEFDRAAERIGELEAGNSRLNEHLRSASRNVGRLEELAGQTISDTRAARAVVAEIAVQVQSLVMELNNWRSGGSGWGGVDNMDDM